MRPILQSLPAAAPDSADIQAKLERMLDSQLFCKAHRLSRLLRFLVEKRLQGSTRDTTEYGIGIDVFDRDPTAYSTGEDPIVRVQIGRLRDKLKTYYAGPGREDELVISIPMGSYMPVIRRAATGPERPKINHLLAVRPLRSVGSDATCAMFALGLSEELSYQLFREYGDKIVSHSFPQESGSADSRPGLPLLPAASHLLEGSVRTDGDLLRAAVRLIDAGSGAIVWSERLDRRGAPGILLQEDLALAICAILRNYFSHG